MATDIHGWVEVRPDASDDEDGWLPLLNAGLIMERHYVAFDRLFGVGSSGKVEALASHRGLPQRISSSVQREFAAAQSYYHSATWATWGELKTVDWSDFDPSFITLWNLLELLAQSRDSDKIRLVVWFDS